MRAIAPGFALTQAATTNSDEGPIHLVVLATGVDPSLNPAQHQGAIIGQAKRGGHSLGKGTVK